MNEWRLFRKYVKAENATYAALIETLPGVATFVKSKEPWLKRVGKAWVSLDQSGITIPPSFLKPYNFPKEDFIPKHLHNLDTFDRLGSEVTVVKYQLRAHNILRELQRWTTLCPEILDMTTSHDILELSSGGCGGAEVAHHYGNTYQTTDYITGRGSVYAPIHKSLNLDAIDFDGSKLPYAFQDNSFDIVACFQAIDAYGREEQYVEFIDEMLRIARQKVVIVFNPGIRAKREKLQTGYEDLIRYPLQKRYANIAFSNCPSTGLPAATIEHK